MFFMHNFVSFFLKSSPQSYKLQAYQTLALSCLIQCKMWLPHPAVNMSPESLLQSLLCSLPKALSPRMHIADLRVCHPGQEAEHPRAC